MSNQIAECTIKSHYVMQVQNAASILFQDLQFWCERENCMYQHSVCSFKNWATTNQLPNKLRWFASLCEQRMSLADLVKVEDRNEEVCCSFH